MDFIQQYKAASRVSTPLLAIRTFDAKSTMDAIRKALGEDKLAQSAFIVWDCQHGLRSPTAKGKTELTFILDGNEAESSIPLAEALKMLEKARDKSETTVFISNAHLQWANEPAVVQGIWNLRDPFKMGGNKVVLLCNPGAVIPTELTNDILVLDEPLPTVLEIEKIVLDTFSYASLEAPEGEIIVKAVDALIGLPSFAAEQSTAMCLNISKKDGKRVGKLDIESLWEHKRQVIAQTPGLSVNKGNEGVDDIGGIEQVKEFCARVMTGNDAPKTIIFIDEIEKAMAGTGTDMSGVKTEMAGSMLSWMQDTDMDGMIFLGLPGVSKSQLAKALGHTYEKPVVIFDIAGMQSGIIGSSGSNLRSAQATVDAISGGRVLAIATCNSITQLSPELRRRFNLGTFFFDSPGAGERAAIWDIYRKKFNVGKGESNPADEGWTGAEIKECCKKAYRLKLTLAEAATYIVPITKSSAEMINALRQASSGKYLSASKPGVYEASESDNTTHVAHETPSVRATAGRILRDNDED